MAAVVGNLFKMANRIVCQPIVQGSVTAVVTATRNFGVSSILQNVRCHFPRPSEVKRIKRHGLKARLSTFNGRKIIMNRILKGRHVLAH